MASFFKDMFAPQQTNNTSSASAAKTPQLISEVNLPRMTPEELKEFEEIRNIPFQKHLEQKQIHLRHTEIAPFEILHPEKRRNMSTDLKRLQSRSVTSEEARASDVDIPDYFYAPDDPVLKILEGIPLGLSIDDLIMYILEQMATYRQHLDRIQMQLSTEIQKNYKTFILGMKQVQEYDLDLTRTTMSCKGVRRKLSEMRENNIKNDLKVVHYYRKRELGKDVLRKLRVLGLFAKKWQRLHTLLARHEIVEAVTLCFRTLELIEINQQVLMQYLLIQNLKNHFLSLLPTMRLEAEKLLVQVIQRFDETVYATAIAAFVALDKRKGDLERRKTGITRVGAIDEFTSRDQLLLLSQTLERITLRESEEAFRQALIDVVHGCELYSKETKNSVTYVQARGMMLSELCQQVTVSSDQPSLVRSLCKAYAKVSDLFYNYHLISNWHHNIRSSRNANSGHENWDSKTSERLKQIGSSLTSNRKVVWSGVQAQLRSVLSSSVSQYPNLSPQSFHNLVLVTNAFISVVGVFCGETTVLASRAMIRDILRDYCEKFHSDNVEIMKNLLKRDSFHRILVNIESLGGFDGLINRGSRKALLKEDSCEYESEPALTAINSWTIERYANEGNPFSRLSEGINDLLHLKSSCNGQNEARDNLDDENDLEQSLVSEKKEEEEYEETPSPVNFVLTTTVVNCLARSVGKYLSLMERLPLVASEVFEKLKNLFDLYILTILTNVVHKKELEAIFDDPGSLTGVRFQRLRQYTTFVNQDVAIKMSNESQIPATPVILTCIENFNVEMEDGLSVGLVAAESLNFALQLLIQARPKLEVLLSPVERSRQCAEVYTDMPAAVEDLNLLIHTSIASRLLVAFLDRECEDILSKNESDSSQVIGNSLGNKSTLIRVLSGISWTLGNRKVDYANKYVFRLIAMMEAIFKHLKTSSKDGKAFPLKLVSSMWNAVSETLFAYMLDGFAVIRECDVMGRSSMIIDLDYLYSKLNEIAPLGETAKREKYRAENYLKVFYFDRETDVMDWIRKNQRNYEAIQMDILRERFQNYSTQQKM